MAEEKFWGVSPKVHEVISMKASDTSVWLYEILVQAYLDYFLSHQEGWI